MRRAAHAVRSTRDMRHVACVPRRSPERRAEHPAQPLHGEGGASEDSRLTSTRDEGVGFPVPACPRSPSELRRPAPGARQTRDGSQRRFAAGEYKGSPHLPELPYLFDLPDAPIQVPLNLDQEALAARMRTAWANFAPSGDPSSAAVRWPSFDVAHVMSLVPPQIETDFASRHHCSFWGAR